MGLRRFIKTARLNREGRRENEESENLYHVFSGFIFGTGYDDANPMGCRGV